MFHVRFTILHAPNCRTLNQSVCCRVLGFHRLITSEHSKRTPRCSSLTPQFFVSEFWVCFRVLGSERFITSLNSAHTPPCSTLTTRFFVSEFSETIFSGFKSNTHTHTRTHIHTSGRQLKITFLDVWDYSKYPDTNIAICFHLNIAFSMRNENGNKIF